MNKSIKILLLICIVCIIVFLYYIHLIKNPILENIVNIESIQDFQNVKGYTKFLVDNSGNLYLTTLSEYGVTRYFSLKGNSIKQIPDKPENVKPIFDSFYGDYVNNLHINNYSLNILYKGDLSCDAEIIFLKTKTPVLFNGNKKTYCFDIYGNNIDKFFVVKSGNIYGTIRTYAYWLNDDKAFYIKELTNFRNPIFVYDKSDDSWFVLTSSVLSRQMEKNNPNGFTSYSLYKMNFNINSNK